jgi:hypothetical protein
MLEKAIEKIKSEMDKNKNNSYIQVVGNFLLQYLNQNPGAAEKILQDGKTIAKSLDEMKKAAEKRRVGNCAVLTDQEGFEIVFKYFEIENNALMVSKVKENSIQAPKISDKLANKNEINFDVKLDDFLA